MTDFDNYLTSEELDVRMKKFIEDQGKSLFNEIQLTKYNNEITNVKYV